MSPFVNEMLKTYNIVEKRLFDIFHKMWTKYCTPCEKTFHNLSTVCG
ncbi:hypothetical protein MUY_000001 [Bacillus licheniformis WX-02]|nr:hypothetical protein MUY_000001 [Bacillus licheniformis WX-02]